MASDNVPASTAPDSAAAAPARRGRARQILLNTITSYFREGVDTLVFLVITPFLIHRLGREAFGLWSLLWAYLSLLALIDMGFGTSVVKTVADARGRNDVDRLGRVICTLFWWYVGLGVAMLLLVGLSIPVFNTVFAIAPEHRRTVQVVLAILGLRSALCMPLGMFRGVLLGQQRATVVNVHKILGSLGYFVAVLLLVRRWPDLRVLALLNLGLGVGPFLAMFLHARRSVPGMSLSPRRFDRSILKDASSFSVYFMLIQVSSVIATRVDSLIIKAFMPLEMVGVYAIAMRLSEKAAQFCTLLFKALTPVVAELTGAGEQQNLRAVWLKGAKLSTAFAMPLLVGLFVLAEPLINAWTGPEFREAVPALRWLLAAALTGVIHGNTGNLLGMGGQQRYLAFTELGSQVTNFVLSVLFIRWWGIAGVAMATFLSDLPFQVWFTQGLAARMYGTGRLSFYRRTLLPTVIPSIAMVALLYGVQALWPLTSLVGVALAEVAGLAVFAALFWWVGLDARERAYLLSRALAACGRQERAQR
jgi:O-antigen/teichoic acid export membrane protein